jgi:multicomponent K+:H+ antiporter subunit G
MNLLADVMISALLLIGAFFLLVGSYALAKFPDMMRRLHGPTKATTLGVGSMLIASMLYFFILTGLPSIHELLITVFLFLTAPVTAHMVAKAHIFEHSDMHASLPDVTPGWATLHPPPNEN